MTGEQPPRWVHVFGEGASEGDPAREDILGGKGASLAALCRAGFPVPPGFTIAAECGPLIEQSGAWPTGLEEQVRAAMSRLEQITGRAFGHGANPLLVAVRSGAAVSMPGMMDTILNCGRGPHADGKEAWAELEQAIHAVCASWNSDRAKAYRRHHDIRGVLGTAVNVQVMFPSERAGVLFTTNPSDPDAAEMVVEASWGLGEGVVSGAVTPDVYILDAATLQVKREEPGDRPAKSDEPALTHQQLHELAELGRRVAAHFACPCDIEWGLANGEFALLQSRPIRGLDVLRDVEAGRSAEIERLRALAGGERVVWVAHNLGETLPAPTPLTWDIVREFMSGAGGYGLMYRDFGYRPSRRVCSDGFLELICGRIYVDPRRAAEMFWHGVPLEYDMEEVLRDPAALGRAPRSINIERADPFLFLRLPGLVWGSLRCAAKVRKARKSAVENFQSKALPQLCRFLEEAGGLDLTALTTEELIAELHRRRHYVLDDFGKESLKPGFFAGQAELALTALLAQLMGEETGAELARLLTSGLDNDATVEQSILLCRVARGEATLDEFLAEHGHRAVGEMELSQPRWREDSSYLERMMKGLRRPGIVPPDERRAQQAAARRQAEAALPGKLAQWGGSSLLERVLAQVRDAQRLLPYRETAKHHLMRGYDTIRSALVELSRRWALGRDLFFLRLDELERFEAQREGLEQAIAARKLRWRSAQRLSLPALIDTAALESLGRPRPRAQGAALAGRPLAPGAAEGVARIVLDPQEAHHLEAGDILVCPSTDPGWTPLFILAAGLIVERGGALSHGAIVARDLGIPAVACENATQRIPAGARIEVDGASGLIRMVAPQT